MHGCFSFLTSSLIGLYEQVRYFHSVLMSMNSFHILENKQEVIENKGEKAKKYKQVVN